MNKSSNELLLDESGTLDIRSQEFGFVPNVTRR